MSSSNERLSMIRQLMKDDDIDAYIIPVTDPHLGEYVPDRWKIIRWLTGFTGSAANVVITSDFAGLWTDSRYFIQAEEQLSGSGLELVKLIIPHTPEYIDWLAGNLPEESRVAVDGRVISIGTVNLLNKTLGREKISLVTDKDYISGIWEDRPAMPADKAFEHSTEFAGLNRREKLRLVRTRMTEMGVDYHLLTSLDDIAWLMNIRGNDVNYSPLFTAFGLVTPDQFLLFADDARIPETLKSDLETDEVTILPYDRISSVISSLEDDYAILITPGTTSAGLYKSIPAKMEIAEDVSIPTRLKAIKNDVEISNIKKVMVRDGVALTKFFSWLDIYMGKQSVTEISAAEKLLSFRMDEENCTGPSFATIAGYRAHGALPHYISTPDTDVLLEQDGIFLVDSGGQYLDGTTDVTRTITLGNPTAKQKRDFTLALKGTIGLALAKFPKGTKGYQIDILARKALWDNGMNYGHGTGHGVGFFLNVHEGPQTIGTGASGDPKTVLEPGMLISDEPAIYMEGEYGFRTENLILCVKDQTTGYGEFLKFETVTLCYIDTSLILTDLLTGDEAKWINDYHVRVYDTLRPLLSDKESEWLKKKTRRINNSTT